MKRGRAVEGVETVTSNFRQYPLDTNAEGKSSETPEKTADWSCYERTLLPVSIGRDCYGQDRLTEGTPVIDIEALLKEH